MLMEAPLLMGGRWLTWRGDGWRQIGDATEGWARGYAFAADDSCLEDDEIAFHLAANRGRLKAAVSELNGCFAAVLDFGTAAALVTDRYGAVPIYVLRGATGAFASSEPWRLIAALPSPPELDLVGALDLLRTGYVFGTRTLIDGLETVAPATIDWIDGTGNRAERYWRYGYRPTRLGQDDAEDQLAGVFARVAGRTSRYLESRGYRAALTLSGGLDSRVLASILENAAPGRFTAFTYGDAENPEVAVAREVATRLGMDHRSVAIDSSYLNDAFVARSVREVGVTTRFTCGVGARHLDAFDIDVLIPGHTGDFVSGGHLPAAVGMVCNRRQLGRYLEFTHCRYRGSEPVLRRILRMDYDAMKWRSLDASTADFDFTDDVFGLIDRWNVENRQRRMILMELRAYEEFGRWMLPFYDHELVDWFATIPHELRFGQRLYIQTARDRLFAARGQEFASLRRIGSRPMKVDSGLARRISLLRRLQPLSGWFLELGLAPLRDLLRTARPKPDQTFGTDLFKKWFRHDPATRAFLLARIEALDSDWIDSRELIEVLRDERSEERVYNRLLPGVLTVQECLNQARDEWRGARTRADTKLTKARNSRPDSS